MKKTLYMTAAVTNYGNGEKFCRFSESIGDGEIKTRRVTELEALRMMWELKLAGGTREVTINQFDRDIFTVCTYIFLVV